MCRHVSRRDVVAALQSAPARVAPYAAVRARGGPMTLGPCTTLLGTHLPATWGFRTRYPDRVAILPAGPSTSAGHARMPRLAAVPAA
jgi:hypothetical protein